MRKICGLWLTAACLLLALSCTKDENTENQLDSATPAARTAVNLEAKAVLAKAWDFLEKSYNKPSEQSPFMDTWGPDCAPAYSALVLNGALRAGVIKPNDERVKKTVAAMLTQQEASGQWTLGGSYAVYSTSMVMAMFSHLKNYGGSFYKDRLASPLAKAMEYLRRAQVGNPNGPLAEAKKDSNSAYGGWAYSEEELKNPANAQKPKANLSTTSFAISAAHEFGVSPDDPLWDTALTFLERTHNSGETSQGLVIKTADGNTVVSPSQDDPNYGGAYYTPDTSKAGEVSAGDGKVILRSYGSMTYALLSSYMMAGLDRNDPRVKLAYKWISHNFSVTRVPGFTNTDDNKDADQQGLYYQYLQMAKALSLYGDDLIETKGDLQVNWRKMMVEQLARSQKDDGSWINDRDRWQEGSPIICTGYVINALADAMKE